jgi:hypothetical protein
MTISCGLEKPLSKAMKEEHELQAAEKGLQSALEATHGPRVPGSDRSSQSREENFSDTRRNGMFIRERVLRE